MIENFYSNSNLSELGNLINNNGVIPPERKGKVRDWGEMEGYFNPLKIDPSCVRFLRCYFRSQLLIIEGKPVKAKRLLNRLDKWTGFADFEEMNQKLLSIVDLGVRGKTIRPAR